MTLTYKIQSVDTVFKVFYLLLKHIKLILASLIPLGSVCSWVLGRSNLLIVVEDLHLFIDVVFLAYFRSELEPHVISSVFGRRLSI